NATMMVVVDGPPNLRHQCPVSALACPRDMSPTDKGGMHSALQIYRHGDCVQAWLRF
ncbi:hypothetical protein BaRGS_00000932, partial [Batillaria attramentaria]